MSVASQSIIEQVTQADGRIYCLFEFTFSNGEKQIQRVRLPAGSNVTTSLTQYAALVADTRAAREIDELID